MRVAVERGNGSSMAEPDNGAILIQLYSDHIRISEIYIGRGHPDSLFLVNLPGVHVHSGLENPYHPSLFFS